MARFASVVVAVAVLALASVSPGVHGIDNGYGWTPPMGWRSWNQFQCDVNQTLMESIYDALVDRSRTVDGVPTSLWDLGYRGAGLDDCWQLCDSGPGGIGFHNSSGDPIVNHTRFPSMPDMVAYAHARNIRAGWYMNNCHCKSPYTADKYFEGDVTAVVNAQFDSVKLDGCGGEKNVAYWATLLNQSGRPVMIENCHNGPNVPAPGWCPFNFFRSSGDIRATYGSVVSNLQTTIQWADVTGPNKNDCGVVWAYPDMLEVGVTFNGNSGIPTLTHTEARSHFGAWCIVSSPLTLSMNLKDDAVVDSVWDIVTNLEAIAVNQAWAGHPGTVVANASSSVMHQHCHWDDSNCTSPAWQVWVKPLPRPSGAAAVLLMNHGTTTQSVATTWEQVGVSCPGGVCYVRDLWTHASVGKVASGVTRDLASHDSAFFVVSPSPVPALSVRV